MLHIRRGRARQVRPGEAWLVMRVRVRARHLSEQDPVWQVQDYGRIIWDYDDLAGAGVQDPWQDCQRNA